MKNWWLYVLKLEQDKWYVGITSQTPERRFWEHQNKVRPACWTLKYPPLEIVESKSLGQMTKEEAEKFENKKVREFLKKLGINNVRGGDLKDTVDYVKRLGRIWKKEDWQITWWSAYMIFASGALLVDKYVHPFIPGGVR